jgi:SAM-dependent methyltransferase
MTLPERAIQRFIRSCRGSKETAERCKTVCSAVPWNAPTGGSTPQTPRAAFRHRSEQHQGREFLDLPGKRIPLPDESVDTVVSTFTLCTIPGVVEAIQGVRRVLKPGGKLTFFEHGLSPDPPVQRWQARSEPLFRWAFEGCHVTRDIPSLIRKGGFKYRKDGGRVPRSVSEVGVVLLVGHSISRT